MYDPRLYIMYRRDELMKDIDKIVDEFFELNYKEDLENRDELVTKLCDAVCERIDGV